MFPVRLLVKVIAIDKVIMRLLLLNDKVIINFTKTLFEEVHYEEVW